MKSSFNFFICSSLVKQSIILIHDGPLKILWRNWNFAVEFYLTKIPVMSVKMPTAGKIHFLWFYSRYFFLGFACCTDPGEDSSEEESSEEDSVEVVTGDLC